MRVLILGARAPACLEWARAMHAAGWEVTVADSLRWPLTRASKAVHHYLPLPEPRCQHAAWVEHLQSAIQRDGFDLILPTCEEAFYLAHARDQLGARIGTHKIHTPPFALMHQLHHKGQFAALTRAWAGCPVQAPESIVLSSPKACSDWLAGAQREPQAGDAPDGRLPWVLKPVYSRFAHRTLIRPQPHALADLLASATQPWLAQRFAAGKEHCSYSLLVAGRLTAHACYHPRYRVGRGSGIWFEPTDLPAIRGFLERFGQETGYTGQVGFDFIESPDGRIQVLECNPRATSGVHLFDDQPEALVQALTGQRPAEAGPLIPHPRPRMVGLAMLVFAAARHGLQPGFWRDYAQAADVISRRGDRAVLAAQIPGMVEIIGRAISRRCGLLAASTADIEWDGQAL